jgi:hypothetical protein
MDLIKKNTFNFHFKKLYFNKYCKFKYYIGEIMSICFVPEQ